jgi:hypothetical protein
MPSAKASAMMSIGALGQQVLVRVALNINALARPLLPVDQIDDQLLELRRILDLVLRLPEDHTQRSRLFAQVFQHMPIGDLQVVTVAVDKRLPPGRHAGKRRIRVEPPIRPFVRHLEEQQERQLLHIVDRRDPVIPQHVTVIPQLRDQPPRIRSVHSNVSFCGAIDFVRLIRSGLCSARIFSSHTEAGSLYGSCGISRPEKASASNARRRSAARRRAECCSL